MLERLRAVREEGGAIATEYIIILVVVALAIVAGATVLGNAINDRLNATGGQVTDLTPTAPDTP